MPSHHHHIAGWVVKTVGKLTYLGCDVNTSGYLLTWHPPANRTCIFDDRSARPHVTSDSTYRQRFEYNNCMTLVLLYHSETYQYNEKNYWKIQAFLMSCQCYTLGMKWSDCVTDDYVLKGTGLEIIHNIISQRWDSQFGYIIFLLTNTPFSRSASLWMGEQNKA